MQVKLRFITRFTVGITGYNIRNSLLDYLILQLIPLLFDLGILRFMPTIGAISIGMGALLWARSQYVCFGILGLVVLLFF